MNELINLVTQKAGIPADKAQAAVDTVVGYLKGRLPAPMASQLDNLLAGSGSAGGMASGLGERVKDIGGMFGTKE